MATDYGNKSIVTDKLHYYMDPANKQSYIGSGTSAGSTVGTVPMGTLGASNIFSNANGGVFDFDGASDYLEIASNGLTAGFNVNSYTVSTWMNMVTPKVGSYDMLFSYDYTAHSNPYYAIHFRADNVNSTYGRFTYEFNKGGVRSGTSLSATPGPYWNQWNLYTATYNHDGTDAFVALYRNGTLLNSQTFSNIAAPTYYNQEVWLGKSNFSAAVEGHQGPFMFYHKALSLAEITHNYNTLKGRFE